VLNCPPAAAQPRQFYPNPTRPIIKALVLRPLTLALLTLAACPAAALAQNDPNGDHFLTSPFIFNAPGQPFPDPPSIPGYIVDTSGNSLQDDLFNPPSAGGPREPRQCPIPGGISNYGKTNWSFLFPHRHGQGKIGTAGAFDSTIALMILDVDPATRNPVPVAGICSDRRAGLSEDFGAGFPALTAGEGYAIQVGGFQDPSSGQFGGGLVELTIEFLRPARLRGDAVLRGGPASNGIRVSEVEVTAPSNSRIEVTCTRGACRRQVANVAAARASRAFRPVIPGASKPSDRRTAQAARALETWAAAAANPPAARTAATRRFLRGRRIRAGARIEVRITSPGKIGQYVRFDIARGRPKPKIRRCLEPFSRRPQRRCDG
jgi:hypothetical protein